MSKLETRVAKIEEQLDSDRKLPKLIVITRRYVKPGELDARYNVIEAQGRTWVRGDDEDEGAFIERAKKECSGQLIQLAIFSREDEPA